MTEEEPRDGHNDLQTRSTETGLLPVQQELLEALADNPDWRDAATSINIHHHRVRRWLREDDVFRRALDNMFKNATEVARLRVNAASEEAVDTLYNLLQETKLVKYKMTCEDCGHTQEEEVSISDAGIRAKAAEIIIKAAGVLKDVRKIEHGGEVLHLNLSQKIGLAQLRAGQMHLVSEQMMNEFRDMGLVDSGGNLAGNEPHVQQVDGPDVVEGESRRVEETDA